jgi:hypothetical protein
MRDISSRVVAPLTAASVAVTSWHERGTRPLGATSGTCRQAADLRFQVERATGIEPAPPAWKRPQAWLLTSCCAKSRGWSRQKDSFSVG